MKEWSRTLFGRTSILIAATLTAFTLLAWQVTMWTTLVPTATLSATMLSQRTVAAIAAYHSGNALPEGARLESGEPRQEGRNARGPFVVYLANVQRSLQESLPDASIVIPRYRPPPEIWIKTSQIPQHWLVLTWRLAGPRAPAAAIAVLVAGVLMVLAVSAWSARRLSAPLANLAVAAARVAEGKPVTITTSDGPTEVRSLAIAFQSMANRLDELESQRELLLAGVSHDLRSPLARMRVAIELLEASDRKLTEQMSIDIDEMDRMIGLFLHYARAGYREAATPASLGDVVRQALVTLTGDSRLRIECAVTAVQPIAVETVRQIVLNLVQNALEYGQPPVAVRATANARQIELRVEDAGDGISEAQWQQALKPFSRLHDSPGTGHSGLGLALVTRLVAACRGTMTAERRPGAFAVVVRLPS